MSKKTQEQKAAEKAEKEQKAKEAAEAKAKADAESSEKSEDKKEEPVEPKKQPQKLVAKKGHVMVRPLVNIHAASDIYLEIDEVKEIPEEIAKGLVEDSRGPLVEILKTS